MLVYEKLCHITAKYRGLNINSSSQKSFRIRVIDIFFHAFVYEAIDSKYSLRLITETVKKCCSTKKTKNKKNQILSWNKIKSIYSDFKVIKLRRKHWISKTAHVYEKEDNLVTYVFLLRSGGGKLAPFLPSVRLACPLHCLLMHI